MLGTRGGGAAGAYCLQHRPHALQEMPGATALSEKAGLKLDIQKTMITASGPITSWQIDGETVETVADFILGGSKITAAMK